MDSKKSTSKYMFTKFGNTERKYHLTWDIVQWEDVKVTEVASTDNLIDPFTKVLEFSAIKCWNLLKKRSNKVLKF